MSEKNSVTFDYASNPALAAIFKNWEIGKSYPLEIRFQLNSMDSNGAKGTIEEVSVDEDGAETEVEMDSAQPVMITIRAGKPATPSEAEPTESAQPYVAP